VFDEIDAIAKQRLSKMVSREIWKADAPEIGQLLTESPDILQLAIYGVNASDDAV
jgi:hypothetical protein